MNPHYRRALKEQLRSYQAENHCLPVKVRVTPYQAREMQLQPTDKVMGVAIEVTAYGSSGLAELGAPLV